MSDEWTPDDREYLSQFASHLPTGPFESPAEQGFIHHLVKVMADDARYDDHVPAPTRFGAFVLDYVVQCRNRRVGFEVDGRDFHEYQRDAYRDAAILDAGHVDAIYRVRASDLYNYPNDVFYLIASADPSLFSDRGKVVLARLAHRRLLEQDKPDAATTFLTGMTWRQEEDLDPDDDDLDGDDDESLGLSEYSESDDTPQRRWERRLSQRIERDEQRFGYRSQRPFMLLIERRLPSDRHMRALAKRLRDYVDSGGGATIASVLVADAARGEDAFDPFWGEDPEGDRGGE